MFYFNLIIIILSAIALIWVIGRVAIKYKMFTLIRGPVGFKVFQGWLKSQNIPAKTFFSPADLKRDFDFLDTAKKLSEVEVDTVLPTLEHLETTVDKIITAFAKEVEASPEYYGVSLNPYWALIKIMSPKDHPDVKDMVFHVDETTLINLSKDYAIIRDRITEETNPLTRAPVNGWSYDGPVVHTAKQIVKFQGTLTADDVDLVYIKDTTNPHRKNK